MFLSNPGVLAAGARTDPVGQQIFTASSSFVVPSGVTAISVVAIGPGGLAQLVSEFGADGSGGGGACAYVNGLPTAPGELLDVVIIPSATTNTARVYLARAGVRLIDVTGGWYSNPGAVVIGTGFSGGVGSAPGGGGNRSGGGAGGYTSGGGAGSVSSSRGGGGTSSLGGSTGASGGGSTSTHGGLYGGGAGVVPGSKGLPGGGCLRIIHGPGRAFPNTNTGDL